MKLQKINLYLLVMALVALPGVSLAAGDSLTYESKEAGLRLKYPAGWIKSESLAGALVAFGVPKEKANLKMVENVTVSVQELPEEFASLDKYTKMYEEQRKKDPMAPQVLESRRSTLAGQTAQRIVCTAKQGGLEIQFLQVWTVKKGRAYLFTYGASKNTYMRFSKEAEKIISSLVFI